MFKIIRFILPIISLSFCCSVRAKIKIVTELSPPYQYIENNIVKGSATDTVRGLFDRSGFDYDIVMYPWARAFKVVSNTPNVFIYSIAKTPARSDQFIWIIPVYSFKPSLVGHKNRKDLNITSLEQAKSKIIAIQRDDFSHKYLVKQGFREGINLIVTPSFVDSWKLLLNNKVDYLIDDNITVPVNELRKWTTSDFKRYLPLTALHLNTYLAANKETDPEIINRLKSLVNN